MAAGFIHFEITWRAEVYSGAPQASSAADFGTLGITFRARKPLHEQDYQQWLDAVSAAQSCRITPTQ